MRTAKRILDFLLAGGTVICAVAMLAVVMIQIISRFALPQAPAWTEEAARYCFIYMVSFAAALGIGAKAYVGFDALPNLLRGKARTVLQVAVLVTIAGLMGTMFWYSIGFVRVGGLRTAATLGIRMSYVHASMCILSASTVVYALIEAGRKIGRPEKREGTR
jgi:TRAP-type C4-dicarboxylate transport system permease small subunit